MNTPHLQINIPISFQQVVDIVRQLSPKEKSILNEVLQEDQDKDEYLVPEDHQKLVMERFDQVRSNPEVLLDWDEAKKTLKA
jgi:hypothetical protein